MHLRSFTCQQIQGLFFMSENPQFWNAASSSLLALATTYGGCTPANLSFTLLTLIHLLKNTCGLTKKPQTTWNFFSLFLLKETLLGEKHNTCKCLVSICWIIPRFTYAKQRNMSWPDEKQVGSGGNKWRKKSKGASGKLFESRSTSDTKPSERQEVAVCKPRNHNKY